MKRAISVLTLAVILTYALSGCGGGPIPTPTPTLTPEPGLPTPRPRCGDGVCDGPENPENCPQDCPPRPTPTTGGEPPLPPGGQSGGETTSPPDEEPPPTQAPTPEPTVPAEEWAGNVDFTCETAGEDKQYLWRAYIDFEFTVAPDGTITGSGAGEFFDDSITMAECICEFIKLGPISAQVSGSRKGDSFQLSIIPSAEMVERCECPGGVVEVPLNQMWACVSVKGGPTNVTIEARDNAWVEWRGGTQLGTGGSITMGTGVTAVYLNK